MAQRHSNDKLQAECTRLHACAAAAMASATKHRQLAASLKSASPGSARKALFSPGGTLRSGDMSKLLQIERHSSTGTSSTYASTQLRDEDEDDDEADDVENVGDEEEEGSSTEVDENESRSNTPTASPARSSPSITNLNKLTVSPSKQSSGNISKVSSVGLEEEVWTTQI